MGCLGAGIALSGMALYILPNLPTPETLKDVQLQTPLRVFTKDGKLISEFGEKRRIPLEFDEIPEPFIQAILAAEDTNFFSHKGVDLRGLGRAVFELAKTGKKKSGGSTITMQVARNFFLTRKQTFQRKFNEIFLALEIERNFDKQSIMELYVNKIYLGHRSYGIAAAAQVYYGQDIKALNLAQLAMIAGLPKAPSRFNPITNPQRAKIRRDWILKRMAFLGFITPEQQEAAEAAPITAKYHGSQPETDAPYLAEMVRKEMLERYGSEAYNLGYSVITTVHSKAHEIAQKAVEDGIIAYDERHGYRGNIGKITLPKPVDGKIKINPKELLKDIPSFGPVRPAIVRSIHENYIQAILRNGKTIAIPFDNMRWAKPFISKNRVGTAPSSPSELVEVGDTIYVRQDNNTEKLARAADKDEPYGVNEPTQWRLSQMPEVQAALVSLNPQDGAIEAVIGGFDFYQSKFNRAIQAGRQPGSSFKPFIYTAAIARGYTAASLINDAPIVYEDAGLENDWRPENSNKKFLGPTRLRKALYKSRNLVSIRLLQQMGVKPTVEYISKFGFPKASLPNNLSLALGSSEITPLDLTTGYAAFANGGYKVEPYFIASIYDANGNLIFEATPPTVCQSCEVDENNREFTDESITLLNEEPLVTESSSVEPESEIAEESATNEGQINAAPRIASERVIYIVRDMMQDVIRKGTGRRAQAMNRGDIAGKTGTTNDQKDAWFAGYNGDLTTTVWVGFDQPQSLGRNEYGAKAALPIWIDFMGGVLRDIPETQYPLPNSIVSVKIDPQSGKATHPGRNDAISEIFRTELAPKMAPEMLTNGESFDPEPGSTIKELF